MHGDDDGHRHAPPTAPDEHRVANLTALNGRVHGSCETVSGRAVASGNGGEVGDVQPGAEGTALGGDDGDADVGACRDV